MAVSTMFFSWSLPSRSSIKGILYPPLTHANTLYFKSAYNVQIVVSDDEPEDRIVNRFRKEVLKAGVLQECRRRRFFENKHDKIKRKSREASRRNRKRFIYSPFTSNNICLLTCIHLLSFISCQEVLASK